VVLRIQSENRWGMWELFAERPGRGPLG